LIPGFALTFAPRNEYPLKISNLAKSAACNGKDIPIIHNNRTSILAQDITISFSYRPQLDTA
jgi:hypothetical protein